MADFLLLGKNCFRAAHGVLPVCSMSDYYNIYFFRIRVFAIFILHFSYNVLPRLSLKSVIYSREPTGTIAQFTPHM